MISVGNRDARKGLDQGFSSHKREMDETELEEGEACSYQDDDENECIDPDVALSYIDEKLQNVLGHFQKDFEGVVSAENLGAKYGIYGSFLPAYRRSPVWSHSRSPSRVHNHSTAQSPTTLRMEGGNHTSLAQTSVPQSLKHGSASTGSTVSYAKKPPSESSLGRQNIKAQSMQVECTPKSEARDQRTLKVRIKVGSDNLSVKKNADIYSGLGLDGSPSSSFDDSPVESEGLSRGLQLDAHGSPSQILQIMTSPLLAVNLLSPLPHDMIQLSEGPRPLKDIFTQSSSKSEHENKIVSGESGTSLLDRKGLPLQVKREGEDSHKAFDFSSKETDIDADSCDELVGNALKLPLLSSTYSTMGDSVKDSLKEKTFDAAIRGPLEPFSIPDNLSDRSNGEANIVDNQLRSVPNVKVSDSRKTRDVKREGTRSSNNSDKVGLKSKKGSKGGSKDTAKQKADKPSSSESGMSLSRGNKQLSSGDKKKLKKSQVHSSSSKKASIDSANDHAQLEKDKQYSDTGANACNSELESSPMQKRLSKAGDKNRKAIDAYKDFFGDIYESEADAMDSPDVPSGERLKTAEVVGKAILADENAIQGRITTLEGHTQAISGMDFKVSSHSVVSLEKGRPIFDPVLGSDIQDNWVCCDKCQAWRLLPPGSKVESLPEKWDCSMLTWLPGMNRCGISDEETTKAVKARYQFLAENPNSLHVPPDRLATIMIAADNLASNMLSDEKPRKSSKSAFRDSLLQQPPSSIRKKQQSIKERTLTEAEESPVMNRPDFLQQSKSNDAYLQINLQKKKDKHRADFRSREGHGKTSKIKSKRERDEMIPRMSKKSKNQILQSGHNCVTTAEYQDNDMKVVSSGIGMTNQKPTDDMDGYSLDTIEKSKAFVEGVQDISCLDVSKSHSGTVALKKRKMESFQDPASSTPSSGKSVPDHDEFSRKKHRISKCEGKESSTSKRSGKSEKRSRSTSRQSLNIAEPLPKDSSFAPPVLTATSSSSKVSGSLKAKSKFQESKGSPVESVSSSPFRFSDKPMSRSKIMVEKDNVEDVVKLATGSPGKHSGDDYHHGGGQSGILKKGDNLEPGQPTSDRRMNEMTGDDDIQNTSASCSEKFSKDSFSHHKDKDTMLKTNSDKGRVKMSEFHDNAHSFGPIYEEREREGKIKVQDQFVSNFDKTEKNSIYNGQEPSVMKSRAQQDNDRKKSSKNFDMDKSEQLISTSARGKSKHLPASDGEKTEKLNCLKSKQCNGANTSADGHVGDLQREPNSNTKCDTQNGAHHIPSKHPISNGNRIKSHDAPSPLRRDATNQNAAIAIKEATSLKHFADRKKGAGSTESTGYYFDAALKFLHGASLLESGKPENTKHADMLQSVKIYSDTAKLCEFCAHEYEKAKDMASAALAYKCMEVAYMRVIYSSHHSASRDRHELQTVLQMVPPGESPSSSASDIDNLNNSATVDKDPQVRNGGSPQHATNLVIAAKNCLNFKRLLNFAQDVNFAMEASRKSRMAFAAANGKMEQEDLKDVIANVKRALDFNFHDVQGLLHLVRLAKDATSR